MKIFKCVVIACVVAGLFGCGGQANTNVVVSNQNRLEINANEVKISPTPIEAASAAGSLATPAEAYRTAYAIREKKDVAGMKKIMAKDVIEFLTMMAEVEKKTLDEEIAQMFDTPQAKTAETRNEKINGNRATIEYLDETGQWDTMDFMKEGDEWKLSLPPKDSFEAGSNTEKKSP